MKKGVLLFLILAMIAGLIGCKSASTVDPGMSSDPGETTVSAPPEETPAPEGVIVMTIRPMATLVVDEKYGFTDLSDIKVSFHFTKGTEERKLERLTSNSGLVLNAGVVFNVSNGESVRLVISTAPAAIKKDTVPGRLWTHEDVVIEMSYDEIKSSTTSSGKFTWTPKRDIQLNEVK